MTTLAQYERARAALAEIKSLPEAKNYIQGIEHLRLHAKQVQDRALMAEAAELQFRAEVKLGELLIEAKNAGQLREGRPKKNDTESASFSLKEIGVSPRQSADAQRKASISERAQLAMIERMRERILSGGATIIDHVARTEDKKERRASREKVLAAIQIALPDKKYGVILADPEWRFEVYSRDTGMDRAADNHYPTSETDDICKRDVASIAADDCVLFLWATVPMLPDALKVMAAWGFDYKSHCIWRKTRIGTGYWFRNAHELLLVGTKGKIPAPAMGEQWESVSEGDNPQHSRKPDWQYELIEHYFPNLPKIELNARRARPGWDVWGYEAPADHSGDATDMIICDEPIDPTTGEILSPAADVSKCVSNSEPVPEDAIEVTAPDAGTGSLSSGDDGLDIPAFLDRRPKAEHAA